MRDELAKLASPRSLTVALLVAYAGVILVGIGDASLGHIDEFSTSERSRELLLTDDWRSVYFNFAPDFKKPPLQYWLIAATMRLSDDKEWPPRLWSAVGAIAALLATGWLARSIEEDGERGRWTPPLAMLLCLSNLGFLFSSRSALLDTWMLTFNTGALAAALSARRDERWWWVAAACIALGAWQKAPTALLLVGVLCLFQAAVGPRDFMRSRVFWMAAAAGVVAAAAWPLWQWWLHGNGYVDVWLVQEMIERTGFVHETHRRIDPPYYLERVWESWLLAGAVSGPAVALLVVHPGLRRNRAALAVGVVAAFLFTLMSFMTFRSPRYAVYVVPMLSAVIAFVLTRLVPGRWLPPVAAILTVPCLVQFPGSLVSRYTKWNEAMVEASVALGAATRDGEQVVLVRTLESKPWIQAMLYYGDHTRPIFQLRDDLFSEQVADLPDAAAGYRGLAPRRCWEFVQRRFPGATVVGTHGDFVHWRAPAVDRSPAGTDACDPWKDSDTR